MLQTYRQKTDNVVPLENMSPCEHEVFVRPLLAPRPQREPKNKLKTSRGKRKYIAAESVCPPVREVLLTGARKIWTSQSGETYAKSKKEKKKKERLVLKDNVSFHLLPSGFGRGRESPTLPENRPEAVVGATIGGLQGKEGKKYPSRSMRVVVPSARRRPGGGRAQITQ